ncbi:hypothetical protein M409DRAFT_23443 [Zasmidium cellare ATCC 36951]|uniref:Uncharacterized protein n=1 Tax=Zasmidium cellare ATCC 36951 TaxID=1080233 RepID=A0A6A6CGR7_ZASCE|nr:uncharacterized protein M409DRAFT_23443 [Zasmidium cellare ATCC 36951]KAF2166251.1 hypothetical protein M409DRAFT_23443 [Zasmidium cellare ATCC 36951]
MKSYTITILLVALLLATIAPLASTWSLAIYDNDDCKPSSYYAYGDDGVSGVSECTRVGTIGANAMCSFTRDGGQTSEPCDFQLDISGNSPFGWAFPDDTTCYFGYDSNCTFETTYLFTTQDCADFPFPKPESGYELYFMCGMDFE